MNIKSIFVVGLMCIMMLSLVLFLPKKNEEIFASDYLRIHIRANSNNQKDQEVKYKVKNEVVKVLTPLLSEAETKEEAIKIINDNILLITKTADSVLRENNFSYSSKAEIRSEFFPTRSYGELTLVSDVYDAVILELGSGKGDNWWCVVYPPMCFVPNDGDDGEIVFKSKILEIIKNFFK